jgi:hypothetical protein
MIEWSIIGSAQLPIQAKRAKSGMHARAFAYPAILCAGTRTSEERDEIPAIFSINNIIR